MLFVKVGVGVAVAVVVLVVAFDTLLMSIGTCCSYIDVTISWEPHQQAQAGGRRLVSMCVSLTHC